MSGPSEADRREARYVLGVMGSDSCPVMPGSLKTAMRHVAETLLEVPEPASTEREQVEDETARELRRLATAIRGMDWMTPEGTAILLEKTAEGRPLAARTPAPSAAQVTGQSLIAAERLRQVEVEGWTAEHDAEHEVTALLRAARCYESPVPGYEPPSGWPWAEKWWKPKGALRNLVRAGALFQAALDADAARESVHNNSAQAGVDRCAEAIDLLLAEVDAARLDAAPIDPGTPDAEVERPDCTWPRCHRSPNPCFAWCKCACHPRSARRAARLRTPGTQKKDPR